MANEAAAEFTGHLLDLTSWTTEQLCSAFDAAERTCYAYREGTRDISARRLGVLLISVKGNDQISGQVEDLVLRYLYARGRAAAA